MHDKSECPIWKQLLRLATTLFEEIAGQIYNTLDLSDIEIYISFLEESCKVRLTANDCRVKSFCVETLDVLWWPFRRMWAYLQN